MLLFATEAQAHSTLISSCHTFCFPRRLLTIHNCDNKFDNECAHFRKEPPIDR